MGIEIILSVIFIPPCVMGMFFIIQKSNSRTDKKMSDKYFIISLPNIVLVIGMMCAVMSMIVLFGFTLFSDERPHLVFYVTFGLFFWFGAYLVLKTISFRVIVENEKITVFSAFRKPYSFTFNEIISAVRQVKKNQVKSERIVIKTISGKKLIVENIEIAYKRFEKRVKAEVENKYLLGFE